MRLRQLDVRNFRCLKSAAVNVNMLTALVGANGSGKSTFLRALNYFYEGPLAVTLEDFYAGNIGEPISIQVRFGELSDREKEAFSTYVQNNEVMVELRIWAADDGGAVTFYHSFHGMKPMHDPFLAVRSEASAPARVGALRTLIEAGAGKYGKTAPGTGVAAEEAMTLWEHENPGECVLHEDDGKFFGPPNKGGPLGPFTQLVFVPAIHDAAEESVATRSNVIGRLVNLVVQDVAASKEVAALVSDFTGRYADLIHEEEAQRLPALAERMTGTLQRYVPGTTVKLSWDAPKVSVSAPQTKVRLNDYILAVEEPELYQHPMQARKFARTLLALAGDESTSLLQVIYSTHSAHFVGVDRFDSVRLVRKVSQPQPLPSATVVRETRLDEVARKVNEAFGREEYSLDRFRATLTSVMTATVNEMFFADTVVLVEGLEDQAIIEAGLRAANIGRARGGSDPCRRQGQS
jgi:putative ATP-dependent endonuclease of the OLD family